MKSIFKIALLITSLYLVLGFAIKSPADTVKLYPVADSYVHYSNPDTNFGNMDFLYCMYSYNPHGPAPQAWILVRFDISSIPEGSVANEAYLYLYVYEEYFPYTYTCRLSVSDWDEYKVTWNNRPQRGGAETRCAGNIGWIRWDVSVNVNSWLKGEIPYGFIITPDYWTDHYIKGWSREYTDSSLRPYLEIDYTPPTSIYPSSLGDIKAIYH